VVSSLLLREPASALPYTLRAVTQGSFGDTIPNSEKLSMVSLELQQFDHQIAAIALALGQCTMVSEDSDLSSVPGLSVENWAVQKTD